MGAGGALRRNRPVESDREQAGKGTNLTGQRVREQAGKVELDRKLGELVLVFYSKSDF